MSRHLLCTLMLLFSVVGILLGNVSGYEFGPRSELLMERAKGYVEHRVDLQGQQYADEVYHQVSYVEEEHRSPFVRFFMTTFKGWLEDKFSAGLLARRQESTHSSADDSGQEEAVEQAEDTKQDKQKVAVDDSEVTIPAANEPDVDEMTDKNKQEPIDESAVDELYQQSSTVNLPDEVTYYQLENGRIDIEQVKRKWLGRVNSAREDRGLEPYTINEVLDKTATDRSYAMRKKGEADHKRFRHSSYYDYEQITNWFADRGVEFENIDRSTYTENIGYAWFDCDENDCTNEAIKSVRRIFDYFMSEEGKAYDVHYRTIVHPRYMEMGFGLVVDEEDNWIYSAQHYGTRVLD